MNPVLVDEFYESTIYTFVITHTIKIYRRHTKDIDIENTTPSKTTHHTTDTLPTLHLPPSLTHSPPQQPFPYFQNPPTPQSRIPTLPTPNQTRYTIPPLPPQLNTRSLPLPFKYPKLGKVQNKPSKKTQYLDTTPLHNQYYQTYNAWTTETMPWSQG